jgi:AraC-like DNA-binding protein
MKTAPNSWRQTLIADLLQSIRLRSSVYFRPELAAPWGCSMAGRGTAFHIVASGTCWLEVWGVQQRTKLSGGDLVVVPRGTAHALRDAPTSQTVDFFDLARNHGGEKNRVFRAGGTGAITRLVCGGTQFENGATDPLLALLPPFIHVKGEEGSAAPWLQATMMHLVEELDSDRPGAEAVVTRLADILFIQAVRLYLDQHATAESGWLAALRDEQIGRALALLHTQPHQPWTVASLAERVAVSRSAFAANFARLVGEPPLHYLTRLRLNAASLRLQSSNDTLQAIAASAGYRSVAAFSKAFKRQVGITPGEYRRAGQPGNSA